MRHHAIIGALVMLLGAAAPAQNSPEYQKLFQQGIDKLQAGDHEGGIAAFQACLEMRPEESVCAYNVACGYSLKNEVEPGLEWFERAGRWGFGNIESNLEHLKTDKDLDNIRSHERFTAAVAQMTAMLASIDEYAKQPAIYVPKALAESEEVPLLVVLHANGSNKEAVIEGSWREVADALGMALLAPSGKQAERKAPAEGMLWFRDFNQYSNRYWTYEKPIDDALAAFKKQKKYDRKNVYLAGEGLGGMVAFNAAVRAPGLYRGVIVEQGPVHVALAQGRGKNAGKMGLRAVLLVQPDEELQGLPRDRVKGHLDQVRSAWVNWGMKGAVVELAKDGEGAAAKRHEQVVAAVRSMMDEEGK